MQVNQVKNFCPVCSSEQYFLPFGSPPRQNVLCPGCKAKNRHRLISLFFKRQTDLFKDANKKFLHIAPEKCFMPGFEKHFGANYYSADLQKPRAAIKMDITAIPYEVNYFDFAYCSHVLEHVEQDITAMREFYRCLQPGGWLTVMVPLSTQEKTYEDPQITSPAEREKHFGQHDHVRIYGTDIVDRLQLTGFAVKTVTASDFMSPDEIEKMAVKKTHQIFFCRK